MKRNARKKTKKNPHPKKHQIKNVKKNQLKILKKTKEATKNPTPKKNIKKRKKSKRECVSVQVSVSILFPESTFDADLSFVVLSFVGRPVVELVSGPPTAFPCGHRCTVGVLPGPTCVPLSPG